jgi:hypothetical protein
MVKTTSADSDVGSLTVARQLPLALGSEAAMVDDPPTFWSPLGQATCMVRYVEPDQTTETSIAPVPVKLKLLERCAGGSITPWCALGSEDGDTAGGAVVVVVGAGAIVVVVTTGAGASGVVVGSPAPPFDVSEVAAVCAPTAADVVVVDDEGRDPDADRVGALEPVAPCASLERESASPCVPELARLGLPDVATRSAIRASDTARMTHQLGRPRTTLGRRPSEDPVP